VAGRALPPSSPFAADDGAPDPALAAAAEGWATDPGMLTELVSALGRARVLVPVVTGADDRAADRSTAVVALPTADGRTGLPVFSGVASLAAWHPEARPVPVPGARAAAAALAEGWELLVLDPAGPVTVVVPGPAVRAMAGGYPWEPAVSDGVVRPEVAEAIRRAASGGDVRAVRVEPGRSAEVAVVLEVRPGLGRAALDALLGVVTRRLAAEEVVAWRVDSLEIRVAPG